MVKTVQGVVHGKTIQLDDDLGVAEGERVEVKVRTIEPAAQWGGGIRRSVGGWAGHPEMDEIMERIQRERKLTLVTHNTSDFQNIPGLRLDDWLTP
jgi:predicted nucleic acid-binding protein